MGGTRKKVVVRQRTGELHHGYLPASLGAEEDLELLLVDGRALALRLSGIKHIAYVRDFNLDDANDPERLGMRAFLSKPRGGGLWVRVQFSEGDIREGLVPGGLSLLDMLLLDRGIFLEPPDRAGNTQRLFIPRSSLTGFEVLGVAGRASPVRRRAGPEPQRQGALFDPVRRD